MSSGSKGLAKRQTRSSNKAKEQNADEKIGMQ
jgi:hypothetical protein